MADRMLMTVLCLCTAILFAQPIPPALSQQTPPEGSTGSTASSEDGASRILSRRMTVHFTAIEEQTVYLNRELTGAVSTQTVRVIGLDGKEKSGEDTAIEVDADESTGLTQLILPEGVLSLIVDTRAGGQLRLIADSIPIGAPPDVLWPKDGMVDIRGGVVQETFQIPQRIFTEDAPLDRYSVQINGASADIAAVIPQRNEIALSGENIPVGSTARIDIRNPAGDTVGATVPSWGYRVGLEKEVATVAEQVALLAQISGLQPDETARLVIKPEPGQTIEPTEVFITGNEAEQPLPIATFSTTRPGPQQFVVSVERHVDPDSGIRTESPESKPYDWP